MSTTINIFLTGVTGYIGGTVLGRFLAHPDVAQFNLTALVRSKEKAKKLETFGVNAVVGSLQDLELLESLASKADYVVSMADADGYDAIKAILRGAKKYYSTKSSPQLIIQTSGTGAIANNDVPGDLAPVQIFDDLNADQIAAIPLTNTHRDVDTELVRADEEGYVKTYIILPSDIYGLASGELVSQGIQHRRSVQVPEIILGSLDRGRGGVIGAGKNIWNNVHIDELADLYMLIFNTIRSNPDKIGHGREGFYFGENGEHTLYDIGKVVAETLVTLGKATDPEPSTFTDEEIQRYFRGSTFWGSTSRARANRSKAIGWRPTRTTKDLLASILPETEALLNDA